MYLVKLINRFGNSLAQAIGAKKQRTVAFSTCEAEYYALSVSAQGVVWLCCVKKEVGFNFAEPTVILSDKDAAMKWAAGERGINWRSKHSDVRLNFARDLVAKGLLDFEHVVMKGNDGDLLPNPSGNHTLKYVCERIRL